MIVALQNRITPRDALLIVLSIAFQTGAIACGKQASLDLRAFTPEAILRDGFYALSLVCLGLQALTWQLVLTRLPLSFAYAAMSAVYVNVLVLSVVVFHEHVTIANAIGAACIIAGIGLMTAGRRTGDAA